MTVRVGIRDGGAARWLSGLLEAAWDVETTAHLSRIGVGSGWRCFQRGRVTAGLLRWMAVAVGPAGWVLTTDPGDVAALGCSNVSEIGSDALPPRSVDLAYARMSLGATAPLSIGELIVPVRAGGWVVLEELDWSTVLPIGASPAARRVGAAAAGLAGAHAREGEAGRRLPGVLAGAGMREVGAAGRVLTGIGSGAVDLLGAVLETSRASMVETGCCTDRDVDDVLAFLRHRPYDVLSPVMFTAWGRRPGPEHTLAARSRDDEEPATRGRKGES